MVFWKFGTLLMISCGYSPETWNNVEFSDLISPFCQLGYQEFFFLRGSMDWLERQVSLILSRHFCSVDLRCLKFWEYDVNQLIYHAVAFSRTRKDLNFSNCFLQFKNSLSLKIVFEFEKYFMPS